MMKKLKAAIRENRGVTLFIAVTIMAILLFISFAVVNIALKSTIFATSGRDSQFAFYAADAGIECALYWDTKPASSKFNPLVDGGAIYCGGTEAFPRAISTDDDIIGTTTSARIGGGDGGAGIPPITRVNTASGSINTTATGNSISTNQFAATAGNLVVVAVRYFRATTWPGPYNITSVVDSAGNSYSYAAGALSNGNRTEIWYKIIPADVASNVVTANFSGPVYFRNINTIQYSGIVGVFPLDATAVGTRASGNPITSGTFTTTQDDEVIVAATEVASTAGGWTAGGGYVIRIETSPSKVLMMEDKIVSSIQSNVTASASHDAANSKTIVVATFKRPLPAAGNNILPPDTSLFSIDMNYGDNPVPYCAVVTVTKNDDDTTLIKSRGYNTCREEDEDNPRKIERGLDVEY